MALQNQTKKLATLAWSALGAISVVIGIISGVPVLADMTRPDVARLAFYDGDEAAITLNSAEDVSPRRVVAAKKIRVEGWVRLAPRETLTLVADVVDLGRYGFLGPGDIAIAAREIRGGLIDVSGADGANADLPGQAGGAGESAGRVTIVAAALRDVSIRGRGGMGGNGLAGQDGADGADARCKRFGGSSPAGNGAPAQAGGAGGLGGAPGLVEIVTHDAASRPDIDLAPGRGGAGARAGRPGKGGKACGDQSGGVDGQLASDGADGEDGAPGAAPLIRRLSDVALQGLSAKIRTASVDPNFSSLTVREMASAAQPGT